MSDTPNSSKAPETSCDVEEVTTGVGQVSISTPSATDTQGTNINLINGLARNYKECGVGNESKSSSLYVIVNFKELEKTTDDVKKMLNSVKYCGTVYSLSLEDRMVNHRNKNKHKNIWKDYKMLEVETLKSDADINSNYGITFENYIAVLELAVHCLTDDLTCLTSKPAFGTSGTFFFWFARGFLNDHPDILTEIKKKIIDALKRRNYVEEKSKVCSLLKAFLKHSI
ncbi:hypothetical protein L5515_001958 [Caenorhabditis briggsae]|uniref:Uncharacterized protein n=1 Tax=Caenorhabditis briggsae TaxID=6238 RepID=A0AAE9E457_CAEBR|nr:hypothetical protein L5515_001958 [Caenorhabditis briggsae]